MHIVSLLRIVRSVVHRVAAPGPDATARSTGRSGLAPHSFGRIDGCLEERPGRIRRSAGWRVDRRPAVTFVLGCLAAGVLGVGPALADGDEAPWVPASAYDEAGIHDGEPRLRARLLVDAGRPTPERARVGVLFDLDPGWHLYWRNSGDTGLPTELDIRAEGATPGEIRWPAPRAFSEADGAFVTYGYADRVLLMTDLALDPDHAGEYTVAVDADVLICRTECIPAGVSMERSLTEALVDSPDNLAVTALFERFEAKLPVAPEALGLALEALYAPSAVRPGDRFDAAIAVRTCVGDAPCVRWRPGPDTPAFFPEREAPVRLRDEGALSPDADPSTTLVSLAGEVDRAPAAPPGRLEGVLGLQAPDGREAAVRVDLPLPFAEAGSEVTVIGPYWQDAAGSTSPPAPGVGLARAVLLALIGGLILNLMPCVLPVLAIKVFAVAEMAGRSRRELLANGAAYTGGILASMAVLAAGVLALRMAGTQVGWGFQFQSPLFVAGIAVVLVAFAMNLFGAYEISVDVGRAAEIGAEAHGNRRSFFEGLLAVVLATPCSAPFLGTAVGFAFAGSPAVIVAIFLAIGVGLALPFALITLVPGWARFVPRPGPWMLQLRAVLGFALLATVVWLVWLTGGVAGTDGVVALLALLLAVAFGLFVFGALQASERTWLRATVALALVVLVVAGLGLVRTRLAASDGARTVAADGDWEPWAPASIEAALGAGEPVLVVFSADWCITCKMNERVVLRSERVERELDRLGVRVFKADWTRRDETIRRELARHGRAGVPLYLVYDPRRPDEPEVLPELLSAGDLVETLRAAARGAGAAT